MMTKATKATIKRLQSMDNSVAKLLAEQCQLAQNRADNEQDGYFEGMNSLITDSQYADDCLFILARGYDCNLLAGLYTRYPSLVQTTVFLGTTAECRIKDINQLAKKMLTD